MLILEFIVLILFVLIHLYAGKLKFIDGVPRSRWLSLAGGISVAYVFLHIFPELEKIQKEITSNKQNNFFISNNHAYIISLLGLSIYYGLERYAINNRPRKDSLSSSYSHRVFWLHITSFFLYNSLIGYLVLHREEHTVKGLIFFSVAMALHFIVNDFGLREHYKEMYERRGRWLLSLGILLGGLIGALTQFSEVTVGILFAFLAGGIILNIFKEELPEDRQSSYGAFVLGAFFYALLLSLN